LQNYCEEKQIEIDKLTKENNDLQDKNKNKMKQIKIDELTEKNNDLKEKNKEKQIEKDELIKEKDNLQGNNKIDKEQIKEVKDKNDEKKLLVESYNSLKRHISFLNELLIPNNSSIIVSINANMPNTDNLIDEYNDNCFDENNYNVDEIKEKIKELQQQVIEMDEKIKFKNKELSLSNNVFTERDTNFNSIIKYGLNEEPNKEK
jgi:FtsZ-binding cell division protein ZapB